MRIIFVTTEYPTEPELQDGGLANYLQRACLALASLGHSPIVLTISRQNGVVMDRGIEIQRIRPRKWVAEEMACRLSLFRAHSASRTLRFSHGLFDGSPGRGDPSLPTGGHHPISASSGPGAAAQPSSSLPSAGSSGWGPWWRKQGDGGPTSNQAHQQFLLERISMLRMRAVFGPSRLIAEGVEKIIRRTIRVIENPFLLDATVWDHSVASSILGGNRYILFFGQLLKLKGCLTIANVVRPLLDRHPDLVLAFAGKENQRNGLGRPMIDHLKLSAGPHHARIIGLGSLRHDQLYPVISSAYCVWLPSLIDNLPNACLESMALGKVVIGTRGASFEQLIDDGVNGVLCEIGDSSSLEAAAERVLAMDAATRDRIGRLAKARIASMEPQKACRELVEFYRSVIEVPSSAG